MASITVQTPYNEYTGNGSSTVYPYTFQLLTSSDLVVKINGSVTAAYSLSGVGTASGGNVTFTTAPANGDVILISREIPLSRSIEYQTNGDFRASTVNLDFNRLWQYLQLAAAKLGGQFRAPYPEQVNEGPSKSARLDRFLAFDATTGQPEASSVTHTQVASAVAAAYSGAAGPLDALSFIQAGTGAVSRTAQDKARDVISAADFGMLPTATATVNDAAFSKALDEAISQGRKLVIKGGNYTMGVALTKTLTAGQACCIEADGVVTLDYPTLTTGHGLTIQGSLTQIQDMTTAAKGNLTVTFASAPSLARGNVFIIYDTTNSRWNSARTYYRAGEFCFVRGVSGSDAQLTSPLYDSYTVADCDVYKMTDCTARVSGIKFTGTTATGLLKISLCINPIVEHVEAYHEGYQCLEFDRCYRPTIVNPMIYNKGGASDDYGVLFSNSQHGRIFGGDLYGRRHAVAIGGGDVVGCVPCRDIKTIGATLKNDISSGVPSADIHGNSEGCEYIDCTIYNGATWGGKDSGYTNCTIFNMSGGMVIYSAEVKGGNQFARGCTFNTGADPSATSRGILDIGGNSTAIGSFTTVETNFIVENCALNGTALSSGTDFVVMANSGSSAYINIKIESITANVNAMGGVLRTRLDSGTANSDAIIVDKISNFPSGTTLHIPAGSAYLNVPQRMQRQTGRLSLDATSGQSYAVSGAAITFRYAYPRVPAGQCTTGGGTALLYNGNRAVWGGIYRLQSTDIWPLIESGDATNWSATTTVSLSWSVGLDEI